MSLCNISMYTLPLTRFVKQMATFSDPIWRSGTCNICLVFTEDVYVSPTGFSKVLSISLPQILLFLSSFIGVTTHCGF
jgi:hypothetical protein